MQVREWLNDIWDAGDDIEGPKLRVILKSGNELDVRWNPENDRWGSDDELSDGGYMIDSRSIAAIQWIN